MKRRMISLILAAAMLFFLLPAAAQHAHAAGLTVDDINTGEMFFRQSTGGTCTLTASAMLVRRAARLNGNGSWPNITEASLRGTAWVEGIGMSWNFSYAGISVSHGNLSSPTEEWLLNMLRSHPEGVVVYNKNKPHAVLITDYTAGVFYCADPAYDYGRIPLTKSILPGGSDAQIIAGLTAYWYVISPTLRVEGGAVRDSVVTIESQPESVSVTGGSTASFKVVAANAVSYQWQWRAGSTGTWSDCTSATSGYNTAVLKPVGTAARNGYQYRCIVGGSSGSVTSDVATLKVLAFSAQPVSTTVSSGSTASFKVAATNAVSYQWQWRAGASGTWKDCSSATAGYNTANLKPVGTAARNGYQYRCVVKDASGNSVTSKAVTLKVLAITAQPASAAVSSGSTASFKVAASNAVSYQWQWRAGSSGTWANCTSATAGYNTATLKPVGTAARNGYQYRCIVKGSSGSITSNVVTLKVLAITGQPVSQSVVRNAPASFQVTALNAASYQWQWRAGASGTWANCSSTTSGYNTANLKPVGTAARNGYQYRCVVKDASGNSVTTGTATLTVK